MSTIHDGDTPRTFADEAEAVTSDGHVEIRLEPYGGFVAALTPAK